MMRPRLMVLMGVVSLGVSFACKPVMAAPPCGALDTRLRPASSDVGHRVGIIFTDFRGQRVAVTGNGASILDTMLTTAPDDSTGFSGLVQCQFEGQTQFGFTVDGRSSSLTLNVDEPTKIYVSQGRDGPSFAVWEEAGDALLLD